MARKSKDNSPPFEPEYWVIARETEDGREYFCGTAENGTVIECSPVFFHAYTFATEADALECIEQLMKPNDLEGFTPSACGGTVVSSNLRAAMKG